MPSPGQIGAFGPVVFETSAAYVRNFEDLVERQEGRYATHDVLNLAQKLQYLGQALAEVDFEMNFVASFCNPQQELEALRGVVDGHTAHPLVIGGYNLGMFVARTLAIKWQAVTNKGELPHARATLRLQEYH